MNITQVLVLVTLLVGISHAQTVASTIANAMDRETITKEIKALAPDARKDYVKMTIAKIKAMPISPEEKTKMIVEASRAMIASAGKVTAAVIAEVYASAPIEMIPAISESLIKNFDQDLNKLSNAQFNAIAKVIIDASVARMDQDHPDAETVRIAALVNMLNAAAKPTIEGEDKVNFVSHLPEDKQEAVEAIVEKLQENDLDAVAAAAGVDEVVDTPDDEKEVPSTDDDTSETPADDDTGEADDEGEGAAIPFIARDHADSLGILGDVIMSVGSDLAANTAKDDSAPSDERDDTDDTDGDVGVPTLPGDGSNTQKPGDGDATTPEPEPSKPYSGQKKQ